MLSFVCRDSDEISRARVRICPFLVGSQDKIGVERGDDV